MKNFFRFVMVSLFAALTCVATLFIHIPVPMVNGYANLGDAIILISAFLFPSAPGIFAAGLGAAFADVLSGYIIYAPATLVVKCGVFAIVMFSLKFRSVVRYASAVVAEIWMVAGYLFYEAVLMGLHSGAFANIVGNLVQGLVSVAVAFVLVPLLSRSKGIQKYMLLYREQSERR